MPAKLIFELNLGHHQILIWNNWEWGRSKGDLRLGWLQLRSVYAP